MKDYLSLLMNPRVLWQEKETYTLKKYSFVKIFCYFIPLLRNGENISDSKYDRYDLPRVFRGVFSLSIHHCGRYPNLICSPLYTLNIKGRKSF